jgi:hypothetical protein
VAVYCHNFQDTNEDLLAASSSIGREMAEQLAVAVQHLGPVVTDRPPNVTPWRTAPQLESRLSIDRVARQRDG